MRKVSRRAQRSIPYVKKTGRIGKIRLDMMENPYGPAPSALKSLRTINRETLSAYPEYETKTLSAHLGVPEECLVLGNGSDELIQSVFDAFCDEGERVLIPVPTFPIILSAARKCGARIIKVHYNDDLSFPKEKFLHTLKQNPKIAVIVSPNNPTGSSVDPQFILHTSSEFPRTLFLVDEAYAEFSKGKSLISDATKSKNIIVTRTFSKAYGLAGLRCGYAVSLPQTIAILKRVCAPYSVNAAALTAATAALSDSRWLSRTVRNILTERHRLKGALNLLGFKCVESDANFLLLYTGTKAESLTESLESKGVLVKNLSGTHPLMDGVLRITVGTESDNRSFLNALLSSIPQSLLVLDVDGTLVDVSGSYHRVIRESVLKLGEVTVSNKEIYSLKSGTGFNDDVDIVCELLRQHGKTYTYSEVEPLFNKLYEGETKGNGAIENEKLLLSPSSLESLSQRFKLAIFTGRTRHHLELLFKRFEIACYFGDVFTLDETPRNKRKPHPFGLLQLLKRTGCERGCYIGDIPDDVRCAKKAGFTAVGVIPPMRNRKTYCKALSDAGADFVLDRIEDLRRLLYE
ncbi:MAG: histidinol-phosphate transaminase [Planctomycetota bacterium]|nr:histidinol-phosphate transaminase [Planctomycetota bacterium]